MRATILVKCVFLVLLFLVDVNLGDETKTTKKTHKKGSHKKRSIHHHHHHHHSKRQDIQQNVLTNASYTHDDLLNARIIMQDQLNGQLDSLHNQTLQEALKNIPDTDISKLPDDIKKLLPANAETHVKIIRLPVKSRVTTIRHIITSNGEHSIQSENNTIHIPVVTSHVVQTITTHVNHSIELSHSLPNNVSVSHVTLLDDKHQDTLGAEESKNVHVKIPVRFITQRLNVTNSLLRVKSSVNNKTQASLSNQYLNQNKTHTVKLPQLTPNINSSSFPPLYSGKVNSSHLVKIFHINVGSQESLPKSPGLTTPTPKISLRFLEPPLNRPQGSLIVQPPFEKFQPVIKTTTTPNYRRPTTRSPQIQRSTSQIPASSHPSRQVGSSDVLRQTAPPTKSLLKPRTTAKPRTSTKPTTSTQPRTTTKPRTSTKPTTSTKPRTTTKPRTSTQLRTSTKPTTPTKRTTSTKPRASTQPRTSTKPTISSNLPGSSRSPTKNKTEKVLQLISSTTTIKPKISVPNSLNKSNGGVFNWTHHLIAYTKEQLCQKYPYRCNRDSQFINEYDHINGFIDAKNGQIRDFLRGNRAYGTYHLDPERETEYYNTDDFTFDNLNGQMSNSPSIKPNIVPPNIGVDSPYDFVNTKNNKQEDQHPSPPQNYKQYSLFSQQYPWFAQQQHLWPSQHHYPSLSYYQEHQYPRTSYYPKLSDYPRLSDYLRLSDYSRLSDYPRPSDYPRSSDYPRPSAYPKSSDYLRHSDYSRSSDYPRPSDYPRSSDYLRHSDYPRTSHYPRLPHYQQHEQFYRSYKHSDSKYPYYSNEKSLHHGPLHTKTMKSIYHSKRNTIKNYKSNMYPTFNFDNFKRHPLILQNAIANGLTYPSRTRRNYYYKQSADINSQRNEKQFKSLHAFKTYNGKVPCNDKNPKSYNSDYYDVIHHSASRRRGSHFGSSNYNYRQPLNSQTRQYGFGR